ncbi:AtpZ/AtpI family protein [Vallitalea okinawensis]|uniref:AtpZ/AtpI family protein n=1 Tax=Vallitalea okinawensis TaxID=2078660 RepID=UPI000CFC8A50
MKGLSLVTQFGLLMAIPIFICILVGSFLDKLLGTQVLFLIIFTILGVLAAFRNMYITGMKYSKKKGKDSNK